MTPSTLAAAGSALCALAAFWLAVRRGERAYFEAYLEGIREGRERQVRDMRPGLERVRAVADRLTEMGRAS